MLRMENQGISNDFQFWEGNDGILVRQQTGRLWRKILLVVVVVLEGEVCVFGVVFLVVLVVGIVQFDKAHDADIFLMADDVVGKMMKKCAHFHDSMHSLNCWRTGRQNLQSKEDGQEFFHLRGKGS